jgi:octaprenyl-diphosphate synthase
MSIATQAKSEEIGRKLSSLYAPIADELAEAEAIFTAELESRSSFVQQIVDHSADFRGKRLRPALVLLTAKACGQIKPDHSVLAAVVEMIHTATLVHDDILDESLIRRHAATVNAEWGNETAVLMGDYLFTHAFHLAASLETTLACRWIGHATNLVCEGEMQQVGNRGNFDLDEEAYFSIIRGKTAELTAVACRLGAHYAGASESTVRAMDEYGRDLGIAFQIADDVLDLWGEERATGKSLGTDLEKQKLTLPLIHLLETSTPKDAQAIRRLLADATPDDRVRVRELLDQSEAPQYAWSQAERYARMAESALDHLPDSPSKSVLRTLTQYVVRRTH